MVKFSNRTLGAMVLALCVSVAQPALSSGGGGGGGSAMPSNSAPDYDPVAEYRSGITAFEAHDYKKAVTAFKRVIAVAPDHAPAQYLLGASFIGLGDYKHAVRPLEAAFKADPTMLDAQRDLAISYAKLGQADKAAAQRDLIQAKQTACAGTCPQAAALDAALSAVNAALAGAAPQALGPSHQMLPLASIDATYVQAVGLINEGRYEPAIALLEDALWRAGPHPDLLTYLGFANRKLGRIDTARRWYGQALAVAPNHRGALEYFGELKLQQGDRAGALDHLARLEQVCGYGCVQADELRAQISGAEQSAS